MNHSWIINKVLVSLWSSSSDRTELRKEGGPLWACCHLVAFRSHLYKDAEELPKAQMLLTHSMWTFTKPIKGSLFYTRYGCSSQPCPEVELQIKKKTNNGDQKQGLFSSFLMEQSIQVILYSVIINGVTVSHLFVNNFKTFQLLCENLNISSVLKLLTTSLLLSVL